MAACLLSARDHEGRRVFDGVTVIAPPHLAWDVTDEDILEMIVQGVNDLRHEQGTPNERAVLQKLLRVHRCENLDANEVFTAVENIGARQLLLVPEASKYRDRNVVTEIPSGRTAAVIQEDQWVPHLASLAARTIKTAKEKDGFLVFSAIENAPARESNQKALEDVDGLYICYLEYQGENDLGALVLKNAERWTALATSGRVKEAFAELDAADINLEHKAQIAVQLASRSGDDDLAVRTIRTALAKGISFPAEMAARFGRIAQLCGDEGTAKSLLDQSIDKVTDVALLEAVLMSCTAMNDGQLLDRTWHRLNSLFPDSEALRENCEVRLIRLCQLVPGDEGLSRPSRSGFSNLHNYVADTLSGKEVADYKPLLDRVMKNWPDHIKLAALCAGLHAQANKAPLKAFELGAWAIEDERYDAFTVRLLLTAMRRSMLMELVPQDNLEIYKPPLAHIINYLSSHPADAQARSILKSVLSVESAGGVGLPILVSMTLDLVGQGAGLASAQSLPQLPPEHELIDFFTHALPWMESQTVVELGVTRLPKELASNNPAGLILSVVS